MPAGGARGRGRLAAHSWRGRGRVPPAARLASARGAVLGRGRGRGGSLFLARPAPEVLCLGGGAGRLGPGSRWRDAAGWAEICKEARCCGPARTAGLPPCGGAGRLGSRAGLVSESGRVGRVGRGARGAGRQKAALPAAAPSWGAGRCESSAALNFQRSGLKPAPPGSIARQAVLNRRPSIAQTALNKEMLAKNDCSVARKAICFGVSKVFRKKNSHERNEFY